MTWGQCQKGEQNRGNKEGDYPSEKLVHQNPCRAFVF